MASDEGTSNEKKFGYDAGVESLEGQAASPKVHTTLHRKLKNRHVAMIRYISLYAYRSNSNELTRPSSIGSVIGTGLFLGSASSLMNGGPVGLLLGYLFVGSICFATMVSACLHQFCAHAI